MIKFIAIIGAGQLGSRHLQSLALLKEEFAIFVFDISEQSLQTAKERYDSCQSETNHIITYTTDFNILPDELELVIIATNSLQRSNTIVTLLNKSKVRYLILEKFLFPSIEEYASINQLLIINGVKAWVNCPRRLFEYYHLVKEMIDSDIKMEVIGNNWGLGSNGVHFIDIFSYLVGSNDLILLNEQLDTKILDSKRNGYVEFTGEVIFGIGLNSIKLVSNDDHLALPLIRISSRDIIVEIKEFDQPKMSIFKKSNLISEENIVVPFQSQLTNKVIEDVFLNGKCNLTEYEESSHIHLSLLNILIKKLREIKNDHSIDICPIT